MVCTRPIKFLIMNPMYTFTNWKMNIHRYQGRKKPFKPLSNSNHHALRRRGPAVTERICGGQRRPLSPEQVREATRRTLLSPGASSHSPHTCRPAHPTQPTRPRPPRPHSLLVRHAAENRRLVRSSAAAAVATWRSSGQPLNSLNESRDVTVAIYQLNPLLS